MSKSNYRQIPQKLHRKEEFTGNTMRGRWEYAYADFRHLDHRVSKGNWAYLVYSYATVIALWDPSEGTAIVNTGRYSNTTTRHQNLCRAWLATDYEEWN